jgi:hypothetical protein
MEITGCMSAIWPVNYYLRHKACGAKFHKRKTTNDRDQTEGNEARSAVEFALADLVEINGVLHRRIPEPILALLVNGDCRILTKTLGIDTMATFAMHESDMFERSANAFSTAAGERAERLLSDIAILDADALAAGCRHAYSNSTMVHGLVQAAEHVYYAMAFKLHEHDKATILAFDDLRRAIDESRRWQKDTDTPPYALRTELDKAADAAEACTTIPNGRDVARYARTTAAIFDERIAANARIDDDALDGMSPF